MTRPNRNRITLRVLRKCGICKKILPALRVICDKKRKSSVIMNNAYENITSYLEELFSNMVDLE